MKVRKVEQLRDEVVGLRPVYVEIGNATELLLKNGEVVMDRRILHSVVKALAASYAVDLKAQRRLLQERLSRKGVLPFYLADGRVFIPLKMRQAVTNNDAVYGYVDLNYVNDPRKEQNNKCLVQLSNGIKLEVLSSQSTVLGVKHTGMAVLEILDVDKGSMTIEDMIMKAVRLIVETIARQVKRL